MMQAPFRTIWYRTAGFVSGVVLAAALAAMPVAAQPTVADLAVAGQFEKILESVNATPGRATDHELQAFGKELARYLDGQKKHDAARQIAIDEAMSKASQAAREGELADGLTQVIMAQSLSDAPGELIEKPGIAALITRAADEAKAAVKDGRWVDALNLYRLLDMAHEESLAYRAEAERTQRHLRLVRMYAPDEFRKMLAARAAEEEDDGGKGEESDEGDAEANIRLGEDDWHKLLEGVSEPLLKDALYRAAVKHVDNPGYAPLLLGAIEAIDTLADTKELHGTFKAMQQPAKLKEFHNRVAVIRDAVEQRAGEIDIVDALGIIDQLLAANRSSLAIPTAVMVYEMTDGAMSQLDTYSGVIWPREMELFSRNTQGTFTGVGIQISLDPRDGRLTVVSPLPDSPAQRAGVQAGDVVVTVDGQDTDAWDLDTAVRMITGPEGSEVVLGLERIGVAEPILTRLRRARIEIESVRGWQREFDGSWNYFVDLQHKIGYVRVSQFIPQTADDLDEAIGWMQKHGGVNGLILDLRFNPGGLLSAAVDMADRFLAAGVIVSTVDATGRATHEPPRARRGRTYADFPVVVLVNHGSASASEIVAGALQDHNRAVIVGSRSFGKGSVQDLYRLEKGTSYLKLTTQYYQLPNGRIIHRKPGAATWGIEPDLEVKMSSEQIQKLDEVRRAADVLVEKRVPGKPGGREVVADKILLDALDPQLSAALLVLKSQLMAPQISTGQLVATPPRGVR